MVLRCLTVRVVDNVHKDAVPPTNQEKSASSPSEHKAPDKQSPKACTTGNPITPTLLYRTIPNLHLKDKRSQLASQSSRTCPSGPQSMRSEVLDILHLYRSSA